MAAGRDVHCIKLVAIQMERYEIGALFHSNLNASNQLI